MVQICNLCRKGEIVTDQKLAGKFCTGCGETFELGAFTDKAACHENSRGQYGLSGTAYNVEKGGFVNSKFTNQTELKKCIEKARLALKRYCDKLYISESFAEMATSHYRILLVKKFLNGRRLNVALAACLYIAIRQEGASVILLDISDVAEANVYDICRCYLRAEKVLLINQEKAQVDPIEYTAHFVDMLNLGNRTFDPVKQVARKITDTANRLVQRMKRDWIHYGRRPSGVCAAAVLVAARVNNVHCSLPDIIAIARVCQATIRRRIEEFIQTPVSKLTLQEFMKEEIDQEEDPPSFRMKSTVEDNLAKVAKYQKIIEKHIEKPETKLRGVYAKFLKNIIVKNEELEKENQLEEAIIQEAITDQTILAVNQNVCEQLSNEDSHQGNPSTEEIAYWAEHRPTARSLGLLKRKSPIESDITESYQDLLSEALDSADDTELEAYIVSDEAEVELRQLEWNSLHGKYLQEKSLKRKSKRKKLKRDTSSQFEATTVSEAVEAAFRGSPSIAQNDINLKELFGEVPNEIKNEEEDDTEEQIVQTHSATDKYKLLGTLIPAKVDVKIEIDEPDWDNLVPLLPTGADNQQDALPGTSRIKFEDDTDEEDPSDYFEPNEDDELAKIMNKYGTKDDYYEGKDEGDYEDCGF